MNRVGWLMAMVLLTAYAAVLAERAAGQGDASSRRRALEENYLEAFGAPSPTTRPANDPQTQELRSLIQQINDMSLPATRRNHAADPAEVITPEPAPSPAPAETAPHSTTRRTGTAVEPSSVVAPVRSARIVHPATGATTLSPEVLDRLKQSIDPEAVDPLRLAEALFRGGHKTEAADFYRKALDSAGKDTDRAWLLYRLGQCLADDQPADAMQQYRQVLADHPESLWAQLAEVQVLILQERQEHRADDLLAVVREELDRTQATHRETVRPKVLPTIKPQKQQLPAGENATPTPPAQPLEPQPETTRVIP